MLGESEGQQKTRNCLLRTESNRQRRSISQEDNSDDSLVEKNRRDNVHSRLSPIKNPLVHLLIDVNDV